MKSLKEPTQERQYALPYHHEVRGFDIGKNHYTGILTRADGNLYEGIVMEDHVKVTRNYVPLTDGEVETDPHAQIIRQCLGTQREFFPITRADYSFIRNGGRGDD